MRTLAEEIAHILPDEPMTARELQLVARVVRHYRPDFTFRNMEAHCLEQAKVIVDHVLRVYYDTDLETLMRGPRSYVATSMRRVLMAAMIDELKVKDQIVFRGFEPLKNRSTCYLSVQTFRENVKYDRKLRKLYEEFLEHIREFKN